MCGNFGTYFLRAKLLRCSCNYYTTKCFSFIGCSKSLGFENLPGATGIYLTIVTNGIPTFSFSKLVDGRGNKLSALKYSRVFTRQLVRYN